MVGRLKGRNCPMEETAPIMIVGKQRAQRGARERDVSLWVICPPSDPLLLIRSYLLTAHSVTE